MKLSVPVSTRDLAPGWGVTFDPATAEVMLAGTPADFAAFHADSVSAQVATQHKGAGRHSIPLTVQLPMAQRVHLIWVHPNRVSVRLTAPPPAAG